MTNSKRKWVQDRITKLDDGIPLEELLEKIQVIKASSWKNVRLNIDLPYGDVVLPEVTMVGERLEADHEYENRLRSEQRTYERKTRQKINKAKKERELYEKLKAKFEHK